jgi:hypothetical protein
MIDRRAMAQELRQARLARVEAETACCDLEELIWQFQHPPLSAPRIAYAFDGFGRPLADWAN